MAISDNILSKGGLLSKGKSSFKKGGGYDFKEFELISIYIKELDSI